MCPIFTDSCSMSWKSQTYSGLSNCLLHKELFYFWLCKWIDMQCLLEWGSSVSAPSDSRGKCCRTSRHAQNQKCLQRSQKKWGNSVVLLMAEPWQRICFIYPVCIKVGVAITMAGRCWKRKSTGPVVNIQQITCAVQGREFLKWVI